MHDSIQDTFSVEFFLLSLCNVLVWDARSDIILKLQRETPTL